jgi:signal transduction histidine kinase
MSAAAVVLAKTSRYTEAASYTEAPCYAEDSSRIENSNYTEDSKYREASVAIASPEERLRDLVHELRQPLSSIEAIAYYLEMTLPAGQLEARQYMSQLQHLVAEANTILEHSVGTLRKGCARAASAR